MNVVTKNVGGLTWKPNYSRKFGQLYKDDDFKVAFVTMPKDYKFEFPDVTKKSASEQKQVDDAESEVEQTKKQFQQSVRGTKRGVPSFFGL